MGRRAVPTPSRRPFLVLKACIIDLMHRDGSIIHLDPHEQIAADLPREIAIDRAVEVFHDLQTLIQEGIHERSDIAATDIYEIPQPEHRRQTFNSELKLIVLSGMKLRLGILASAELVQASLENDEELDKLIDLEHLYDK